MSFAVYSYENCDAPWVVFGAAYGVRYGDASVWCGFAVDAETFRVAWGNVFVGAFTGVRAARLLLDYVKEKSIWNSHLP